MALSLSGEDPRGPRRSANYGSCGTPGGPLMPRISSPSWLRRARLASCANWSAIGKKSVYMLARGLVLQLSACSRLRRVDIACQVSRVPHTFQGFVRLAISSLKSAL
jgi:hypothetical protein